MEKDQCLLGIYADGYKKMVSRQEGVNFLGLQSVLIYRAPTTGVVTSHLRVAQLYGGSNEHPANSPTMVGRYLYR